jgi:outer membrane porin, OprD family
MMSASKVPANFMTRPPQEGFRDAPVPAPGSVRAGHRGLMAAAALALLIPVPRSLRAEENTPALDGNAPVFVAEQSQAHERDQEPNEQYEVQGMALSPALPEFWDGTSLLLKPRTYFLDRQRDSGIDSVAWALGGALEYKSGWWLGQFQLAGTLFTSQKIYGPLDQDGTQLLLPGQKSFTVFGEAYGTWQIEPGTGIRVGLQSFDLPYLARQDIRMVPNTFKAAAFGRKSETGFSYIGGYVDGIKLRNSDSFIPMSQAAGAQGSNKGLAFLGAQYAFSDGSLIGAVNQTSIDVMNTFYIHADKPFKLSEYVSLRASAQYTDQHSTGTELIGNFATHLAALKAELFLGNFDFRLAASRAGDNKGIQSPYGGPPNYVGIIVDTFDRAGEKAWMVGMSYDFVGVGIKGLSAFANVSTGHTPQSGANASPDETEYDLTIDYRFAKDSKFQNLWIRVREAYVDQNKQQGGTSFSDFRIIVNYSFNLLN